ncbi:DUF1293 family protein, partial [Vibrio atlanticus]
PNDPLDILVNKLVPVDEEIKKHFDNFMKANKA